MYSLETGRAEHRVCKALQFSPAQLCRQLGIKEQTSHTSWQQGRSQCWQQPLRLHMPLNSPLLALLPPEDTGGQSASSWPEALTSHAFLCRTAMEPPTSTLPWVQGSLSMFHSAGLKTCGATVRVCQQSAHRTRRIQVLNLTSVSFLLLGVSQKLPDVWAVWKPRPTFRSKGPSY